MEGALHTRTLGVCALDCAEHPRALRTSLRRAPAYAGRVVPVMTHAASALVGEGVGVRHGRPASRSHPPGSPRSATAGAPRSAPLQVLGTPGSLAWPCWTQWTARLGGGLPAAGESQHPDRLRQRCWSGGERVRGGSHPSDVAAVLAFVSSLSLVAVGVGKGGTQQASRRMEPLNHTPSDQPGLCCLTVEQQRRLTR